MRFLLGRRRLMQAAIAIAAPGAVVRPASAETFPSRPVRLVVPFAPGGGVDATARIIADHLSPALGQPVVVENRAGAGGAIGVEAVAKSTPDGYTITMVSPGNMTAGPVVRPTPYDPHALGFITRAVRSPLLLVCRKNLPSRDLAAFIALVKQKPDAIRFASGGVGTVTQLAAELVNLRLGVRMVHVPYRGTGPAMTDLIAGNVDIFFSDTSALGAVQQEQVRLLAVSTGSRWPQMPEAPSMAEAIPGYDISNWYGVVAPPGTPDAILMRLQQEIAKVLAKPEVAEALRRIGFDPAPLSPWEFGDFVRTEYATWAEVVQATGIKVE